MLQFILKRLGLVIPTFIGITLLTFAFVHIDPGDPVMIMAGERRVPDAMPSFWPNSAWISRCWQQYLHYIWGVLHGDFRHFIEKPTPGVGRPRAAL
ncbi:peptide ABC transporter permease [Escherichia coli]